MEIPIYEWHIHFLRFPERFQNIVRELQNAHKPAQWIYEWVGADKELSTTIVKDDYQIRITSREGWDWAYILYQTLEDDIVKVHYQFELTVKLHPWSIKCDEYQHADSELVFKESQRIIKLLDDNVLRKALSKRFERQIGQE